jgi:hypothetical protein
VSINIKNDKRWNQHCHPKHGEVVLETLDDCFSCTQKPATSSKSEPGKYKQTNKEPHTTAATHLFTKPTLYTRKNCAISFPSFHHQESTIFTT